ncbi:MAG: FkbM family methyltransferase, partial [Flavobacteriales bacterium]|nr:FkbM family methyltransferase [Flavobacteriales bacterium]
AFHMINVKTNNFLQSIESISLDSFFKDATCKPDLVKIDVEGAELEVLQSFKEVLVQSKPIILMEILPVYNKENKQRLIRQEKIQELLVECNYSIMRLHKDRDKINSIEKLANIEIHSNIEFCEYVCVHESDVNQVFNIQF